MDEQEQFLIDKLKELQQDADEIKKQQLSLLRGQDDSAGAEILYTAFQLLEKINEQMQWFTNYELENIRCLKDEEKKYR